MREAVWYCSRVLPHHFETGKARGKGQPLLPETMAIGHCRETTRFSTFSIRRAINATTANIYTSDQGGIVGSAEPLIRCHLLRTGAQNALKLVTVS